MMINLGNSSDSHRLIPEDEVRRYVHKESENLKDEVRGVDFLSPHYFEDPYDVYQEDEQDVIWYAMENDVSPKFFDLCLYPSVQRLAIVRIAL